MSFSLPAVVALLAASTITIGAAAQEKSAPAKPTPPSKTLSLVGCVVADPDKPGSFTLSDEDEGVRYRLTGMNFRDYAGHRVQVSGPTPKRLRIVGGLYPSPNVAAQGGSIDPTKAAMAGMERSATSPALSEFSVKSVRAISGACPEE